MAATPITVTLNLRSKRDAEILADALERGAAVRVTAARRAAAELEADDGTPDKRTGAVKIARTLAEADALEEGAAAIRAALTSPAPRARSAAADAAASQHVADTLREGGTITPGSLAAARAAAEAALEDAEPADPSIDPATGLPRDPLDAAVELLDPDAPDEDEADDGTAPVDEPTAAEAAEGAAAIDLGDEVAP